VTGNSRQYLGHYVRCLAFLLILTKSEFSREILMKVLIYNFTEIRPERSALTCTSAVRETEGYDRGNKSFSQLRKQS
jgi:hypothetical protein